MVRMCDVLWKTQVWAGSRDTDNEPEQLKAVRAMVE